MATKKPATKKAASKTPARKAATEKAAGKKPAGRKPAESKQAAGKKPAGRKPAESKQPVSKTSAEPKKPRVFAIPFASVYPLYVQKAEKKGRTRAEVDQVIAWLTGYRGKSLERVIADQVDLEGFFAGAPRWNPRADLIKGVVCGMRVETIAEPLMQKIRYLDKLVDELAQGKKMESILRA